MKKYFAFSILAACLLFMSCNRSNEALGDKYVKEENKEAAIMHYTLAIDEGSMEALHKLVLLYRNSHDKEKAKECLLIGYAKGDEKSAIGLAALDFSEANYEDVVKYLQPLADKGNIEVVYDLGSSLLKLGRYDEAIEYLLRDAETVYTKDPLGEAYYESGDLANAEKYWKSAVDNHRSGAVNAHRKLLKLYQEQGRLDDYKKYENAY